MSRPSPAPAWFRIVVLAGSLVLVALLFIPLPTVARHDRVIAIMGELVHIAIFAAVAITLYVLGPLAGRLAPAMVVAAILGGGSEFAQLLVGRDAQWQDFGLDLIGIGGVAAVLLLWQGRRRAGAVLAVLVAAGLFVALRPLPPILRASANARASLPLLADFEDPDQVSLWFDLNGAEHAVVPADSLHGDVLQLTTDAVRKWPALAVVRLPHDWSAYAALRVDVRLRPPSADSLRVWVRLLDYEAKIDNEWAQRSYVATHAWRTLTFPLRGLRSRGNVRTIDLTDVHTLTIGVSTEHGPAALQIDDLRLGAAPAPVDSAGAGR